MLKFGIGRSQLMGLYVSVEREQESRIEGRRDCITVVAQASWYKSIGARDESVQCGLGTRYDAYCCASQSLKTCWLLTLAVARRWRQI